MKSTFLDELSNDLFELLDKAEDYNVIIQAGDPINPKEFKAHSVLLRARSGYFRSALSNDWPRKSGDLIVFRKPNIPSGIFEIILKYIYSGIIELDQLDGADLLRLMLASDELQLPILISHAQDHLIKAQPEWINQTLVPILHIVCHHGTFGKLRDYTLKTVCASPQILFESKDFLNLEESVLLYLLKRDDLIWNEINIWDHVIKWGIANTTQSKLNDNISNWSDKDFEDLEFTLHRCIPLIRFALISSGDFFHKIRKPFRKLLPPLIEEQILQFYLDPESRLHNIFLPRNISSDPIDSVLIDGRHTTLISNWIDKKDKKLNLKRKNPYKFNLLIRASRDGFGVDVFHNQCDSIARTLVLAKVKGSNQIVGGYNPVKWNLSENSHGTSMGIHKSFKKFGSTMDSFLFSFNDTHNPTMAILSRISESLEDEAIYFSHNYGPCFGQNDLHMVDQSWNCRKTSYSNEILEGSSNFIADDYEVFQILENDGLKEKKTEVLEERRMFIHSFDGYIR